MPAAKFDNLINDFTRMEEKCQIIKDLEHNADKQVQKIYKQLNHSFITPIDCEDIFMLTKRLDQITDQIDSTAQNFLMYNVESITDSARVFSQLIIKSCDALTEAVRELKHFKKVNNIHEKIRKVNELEHEGDDLYHSSVKSLFKDNHDPLFVIKWREIYRKLESVLDVCEDLANSILGVVLKNS